MDARQRKANEDFERETVAAINSCADWLFENAPELAHEFAGGCKGWSIGFEAGDDGIFDFIQVRTAHEALHVLPYPRR